MKKLVTMVLLLIGFNQQLMANPELASFNELDAIPVTGNYADINQLGMDNNVNLRQQGQHQQAKINQIDSMNTAELAQVGRDNQIVLLQQGHMNKGMACASGIF